MPRSDPGPPVALGFQIKDGKLIGPRDMFADPSFDRARATANEAMDYLRRHGPFEPHRLALASSTPPCASSSSAWPTAGRRCPSPPRKPALSAR